MSSKKKQFSHAATILPCSDIERSMAYYRDALGFDINFTWPLEGPVTYAVLAREDAINIHLTLREDEVSMSGTKAGIYIFVHDVNALFEEYQKSGAEITSALADQDYGMRDFDVRDPDGYQLTFGTGLERMQ